MLEKSIKLESQTIGNFQIDVFSDEKARFAGETDTGKDNKGSTGNDRTYKHRDIGLQLPEKPEAQKYP